MAASTDDNAADGNSGKYKVEIIWRRGTGTIFTDALDHSDKTDRETFASEWASSSVWQADQNESGWDLTEEESSRRYERCARIWDAAQMTVGDMIKTSGMSLTRFSYEFMIPYRTVRHWAADDRKTPAYIALLFAQSLGLLQKRFRAFYLQAPNHLLSPTKDKLL